jgi:Rrf2 family protein
MLTNKAKYGLKAMLHLAEVSTGQPVLVAEISAANNMPKKFLDAIFGELRTAGLVHSKKGRGGGFVLASSPSQITVGEIVRALDGPLALIACASTRYYRGCDDCPRESKCRVRLMMLEVRNAIANVLDNRSLEDMRMLVVSKMPPPRRQVKPHVVADKAPASKRETQTAAKPIRPASARKAQRG